MKNHGLSFIEIRQKITAGLEKFFIVCYNADLSGERGERPLRARRRKIPKREAVLPPATGRNRPLEKSEKADRFLYPAGISGQNASAGKTRPRKPVIAGEGNNDKGDKAMKRKFNNKSLSFILCLMLIVAMAFTTTGCNKGAESKPQTESVQETGSEENAQKTEAAAEQEVQAEVLGEGKTVFSLTVTEGTGKETLFEIHTDKTTVGEALVELGLVEGEVQQYGLYVKSVNGITADYDVDKTYWAFYIDGEYAQTGIDQTKIEEGSSYALRVEK